MPAGVSYGFVRHPGGHADSRDRDQADQEIQSVERPREARRAEEKNHASGRDRPEQIADANPENVRHRNVAPPASIQAVDSETDYFRHHPDGNGETQRGHFAWRNREIETQQERQCARKAENRNLNEPYYRPFPQKCQQTLFPAPIPIRTTSMTWFNTSFCFDA